MEGAESKDKTRILPQWMTDEKVNRPLHRGMKRKKEISVTKRTVYCMNEVELVEYAMEIINKSKLLAVKKEKDSIMIDQDGDVEQPPASPTAMSRNQKMPPSPVRGLETTTAKSGTLFDSDDDDPLKLVREIFFS